MSEATIKTMLTEALVLVKDLEGSVANDLFEGPSWHTIFEARDSLAEIRGLIADSLWLVEGDEK